MLHEEVVVGMQQVVVNKLSDIEVICNEIIDGGYFAAFYLSFDVGIPLTTLHRLTPYLGRQSVFLGSALVPARAAFQKIRLRGIDSLLDIVRQRQLHAALDGIVDVSVATLL